MKLKLQLVIESDNETSESIKQIVTLERQQLQSSTLGLSLQEAKEILSSLQQTLLSHQVSEYVHHQQLCPNCSKLRACKGHHEITYRSVFGKIKLKSPRFYNCSCEKSSSQHSFSPLAQLLTEHTSTELLYLETKFASLLPYGVTVDLLQDILPLDSQLNTTTVRRQTYKVTEKLESEIAEEKIFYMSKEDWPVVPEVKGAEPIVVGLDGAYVHSKHKQGRRDSCFEVIVGKSLAEGRPTKCFGFVNSYEKKPQRKIFEVLKSQGLERGQPVTFLSDGGDTVKELGFYIYPYSENILDWFHITMRLTVIGQMLKAVVKGNNKNRIAGIEKDLESLKWYLWHGNVYRALHKTDFLMDSIECLNTNSEQKKLSKAMEEFDTYIKYNSHLIVNYGDRYRYGERISTGFVESTVNQVVSKRFVKKQQMHWTKRGAHLLLQTRTKVY